MRVIISMFALCSLVIVANFRFTVGLFLAYTLELTLEFSYSMRFVYQITTLQRISKDIVIFNINGILLIHV